MEFGISAGHITAVDYIQHAERLGFTRCWITDTPLLRSNLFAMWAAAALQTKTIRIGSGVAVCGLRLAPEAANGIATINALAPGRTYAIFGTGNTAMRMLGLPAMSAKGLREYVRVVRGLLRGEEVAYSAGSESHPVRFTALEQKQIRLEPPVPIHIAANGPLGQAVAGEIADGLCTAIPRGGTIGQAMANVRRGAERAGRKLPAGFHTAALLNVLMLEPGEALNSPRVIAEVGPAIMTNFHYLVDWVHQFGFEPPPYVRPVWNDYMAFRRARAAGDAHLTMHASHYAAIDPEEARFITPEIIRALCIVGEPPELVERLRQLDRDGLNQVTFHPTFERRYEVIERFARLVMARM
ncbi:MAG: LLM class flavin-dependent oxidoreductase [Candidatus Lambdaproteobacteria bacterium]|nr:LLM class flavin-dependent oxidoreductase [Candidatus Lambdaproteobacteria bacterium]